MRGDRIFQIFGSQGPSDLLVVNTLRWERRLEEKRRRVEEYVEHLVMSVRSSSLLSSSSTDASFPTFPFLHLPSAFIVKIPKMCCPLPPVACEVNVAATSVVLLPGCKSEMFVHFVPFSF